MVVLLQCVFEIGRACQDQPGHVAPVVSDEHLHGNLRHLANIVLTFLEAQPREAERRLAATAVLLRQVDGELVQDLA
jgi:hypothetical protein